MARTVRQVRINIQLPVELREAVEVESKGTGESVSAFFRRSAEERLERLRREHEERRLEEAYRTMGSDQALTSKEWGAVDREGWE